MNTLIPSNFNLKEKWIVMYFLLIWWEGKFTLSHLLVLYPEEECKRGCYNSQAYMPDWCLRVFRIHSYDHIWKTNVLKHWAFICKLWYFKFSINIFYINWGLWTRWFCLWLIGYSGFHMVTLSDSVLGLGEGKGERRSWDPAFWLIPWSGSGPGIRDRVKSTV